MRHIPNPIPSFLKLNFDVPVSRTPCPADINPYLYPASTHLNMISGLTLNLFEDTPRAIIFSRLNILNAYVESAISVPNAIAANRLKKN